MLASQIADRLRKLADKIEDLEDEAQDAGVDLDSLEDLTGDLSQALRDVQDEIEESETKDKEEEEED